MEIGNILSSKTPLDAVGDSVIRAYQTWLPLSIRQPQDGYCRSASANMALILSSEYGDQFDKIFLLTTQDFDNDSPISKHHQDHHTYAVAHGNDGYWYAASPSGDKTKIGEMYALRIIREDSLKSILMRITKRDGGYWPKETDITKLINGDVYMKPNALTREVFEVKRRQAITTGGLPIKHIKIL